MTRPFIKADIEIKNEIIQTLDLASYGVYLTILSHKNTESDSCFPSRKLLAKECNLSERTITRYLTQLYENQFIVIESGMFNKANTYYFPLEDIYTKEEREHFMNIERKEANNRKEEEDDNV